MSKANKIPLKDNRYREFLSIIINSQPSGIHIHRHAPTGTIIDKEGNIRFTLTLDDLGLTASSYRKYKQSIKSKFCINFIGEFLVRENLDQFAELLTGGDLTEHTSVINSRSHVMFGLESRSSGVTFGFHASLLQQILAEDFKMQVQDFV